MWKDEELDSILPIKPNCKRYLILHLLAGMPAALRIIAGKEDEDGSFVGGAAMATMVTDPDWSLDRIDESKTSTWPHTRTYQHSKRSNSSAEGSMSTKSQPSKPTRINSLKPS